jgi:hypothetical protein
VVPEPARLGGGQLGSVMAVGIIGHAVLPTAPQDSDPGELRGHAWPGTFADHGRALSHTPFEVADRPGGSVLPRMRSTKTCAWRDSAYPVIFIDAIVVKARDGQVRNKPI